MCWGYSIGIYTQSEDLLPIQTRTERKVGVTVPGDVWIQISLIVSIVRDKVIRQRHIIQWDFELPNFFLSLHKGNTKTSDTTRVDSTRKRGGVSQKTHPYRLYRRSNRTDRRVDLTNLFNTSFHARPYRERCTGEVLRSTLYHQSPSV